MKTTSQQLLPNPVKPPMSRYFNSIPLLILDNATSSVISEKTGGVTTLGGYDRRQRRAHVNVTKMVIGFTFTLVLLLFPLQLPVADSFLVSPTRRRYGIRTTPPTMDRWPSTSASRDTACREMWKESASKMGSGAAHSLSAKVWDTSAEEIKCPCVWILLAAFTCTIALHTVNNVIVWERIHVQYDDEPW